MFGFDGVSIALKCRSPRRSISLLHGSRHESTRPNASPRHPLSARWDRPQSVDLGLHPHIVQKIWKTLLARREFRLPLEPNDQKRPRQLSVLQKNPLESKQPIFFITVTYPARKVHLLYATHIRCSDLWFIRCLLCVDVHRMASRAAKAKATVYKDVESSDEEPEEVESEDESS